MLQVMRKKCTHPGDASDPHPLCHSCQERVKGKEGLCTPGDTCPACESLSEDQWRTLLKLRQRREKRRQKSAEAKVLLCNKVLSDSLSVISDQQATTSTAMPDTDAVTEKRQKLKSRDSAKFDSFVSPSSSEQQVNDNRRQSKGEKRSRSSSDSESDRGSRRDRPIAKPRRRSPVMYDERYGVPMRMGPPMYDRYHQPYPYDYYDDFRRPPRRSRSRSGGNSQFRFVDSQRERRSPSRRRSQYGRERSQSRRPRDSPRRSRSGSRRDRRSRSKSRHTDSAKRHKGASRNSSPIDDSDIRVVSPPASPVRSRPNVKYTARKQPMTAASQRTSAENIQTASPAKVSQETGEDKARTPREPNLVGPRGDESTARRNLDFDHDGDESEPEASEAAEETEFPFKDVIRLIAQLSEADIRDVKTKSQKRKLSLLSDDVTSEPADYAALTTASGIVAGADAWMEEFFDRDVAQAKGKPVRFNDIFRSKLLKPGFRTYKEGDDKLRLAALDKPKRSFNWLPQPSKRHSVWEADMMYLEELARGGLRVVSFKELVNQALNKSIATTSADAERLHRCNKEANKELLRVLVCLLGAITQLRRDDVIGRIKDTLTTAQRARLRHADMVTAKELFPPELLDEIDKEYQTSLTNKALQQTLRQPRTGGGHSSSSHQPSGRTGSSNRRQQNPKADSGTHHHHRPGTGQSR